MLSRSEQRLLRALGRRRRRDAEGLFLAEGVRVVEDLLAAGLVLRLAVISSSLEDTARGRALLERLRRGVGVREVSEAELRTLAGTETPQGVLVAAAVPAVELRQVEPGERAAVLVLDGVQDPGNVGTLVRTAAALGAAAVISLPGTADVWNAKAVRSSAGAVFRVAVVGAAWEPAREWLRERGFVIYGADAGGRDVSGIERADRTALVVGNEGGGLGAGVVRDADGLVAVPIRPGVDSLNVAVAAGILLFALAGREARGGESG